MIYQERREAEKGCRKEGESIDRGLELVESQLTLALEITITLWAAGSPNGQLQNSDPALLTPGPGEIEWWQGISRYPRDGGFFLPCSNARTADDDCDRLVGAMR